MKKIFSFMAIAALCAGFVACDEVEEGGAGPQTNPQEPVMEQNGIAVELYKATAEAVSLADYNAEQGKALVPMLEVTKLENFPEGYTLGGYMYLANNEDMTDAVALPLTFVDNNLCVSVDEWENAHINLYTKNPKAVESYVDFELLAIDGGSNMRLGDLRYAYHKVTVTPLPAQNPVEQSYTMYVNNVAQDMVAANPDDVYDPPTFSSVAEVPEDGSVEVYFVSESGKKYGMGEAEGTLVVDGAPITIDTAGPQKVTINMETLTYSYALAVETLYAYSSAATQSYALTTWDYVTYRGFAGFAQPGFMLANEQKLVPGMKWGAATDGDNIIDGQIALGSTTKIPLEQKGCYWLNVNLSKLTYVAEYCEFFELIGEFNGWSDDTVKLTPDAKFVVWTGELTIATGEEFKIRTNGSWDDVNPNLGGGEWEADQNAYVGLQEHSSDNLVWELESGTYDVTLDLSTMPYTLKVAKK